MQITRLSVKNWACHKSFTATFRPGLVGILGANGSGKSTLMDALRYGITGSSIGAGSNADNILVGEKAASIAVDFTYQGVDYAIKRALPAPGPFMKYADKTVTGAANIVSTLEALLNTSVEAMLQNVFIGQHAIDDILFKTQTERLKEFQETCGLSRAAEGYKLLGAELSQYKVTHGLQGQLDTALAFAKTASEELAKLRVELVELAESRKELEAHAALLQAYRLQQDQVAAHADLLVRISTVSDVSKASEAALQASLKREALLVSLVSNSRGAALEAERMLIEQRSVHAQTKMLQDELAALPSGEALPIPAEMIQELEKTSAKLVKLQSIAKGEAPLPQLSDDAELQATLQASEESFKELSKEDPDVSVMESELKHLREHVRVFASGSCPTCLRPIDNFDPAQLQVSITSKQSTVDRLRTERKTTLARLTVDIKHYREALATRRASALEAVKRGVKSTQEKLTALALEHQQLLKAQASAEAAKVRRAGIAATLSQLPPVSQSIIETLEGTCQTFKKAEKDLQVASQEVALHRQAKTAADESREGLEKLASSFICPAALPTTEELDLWTASAAKVSAQTLLQRQLESRIGMHEAKLAQFQATVESLVKQRDSEAAVTRWVNLCSRARDLLHVNGIPTLLMREFAHKLNKRMSYYMDMWESPFKLQLGDDLSFMSHFPSGRSYSAARLSGGQKIVASTSFRLAMSDTFARNVGLLILDEPSNHLDKDNIVHLQQLLIKLKHLAGQSGRQILIVTHEESLVGFFDHTITLGSP